MSQYAAKLTPSDASTVAGALVWAYQKVTGHAPVRIESWLYPLALSSNETAAWTSLFNWNAGNITTLGVTTDWYSNPKVTNGLKFVNYKTLGAGCVGLMGWLFSHGLLTPADNGDYDSFMSGLDSSGYAGTNYPALSGLVSSLYETVPKRYWEITTYTAVAAGIGILGSAAAIAWLIEPELFKMPRMLAARENPESTHVQSLLFSRKDWTESAAKKWARGHGYKVKKVDVTDDYIRLQQVPPDEFSVLRTKNFSDGIKAVIGKI